MPLSTRRGTPRGLSRFGSLNHELGGTIKPLRLVEADTNPDLTSAFGGTAARGGDLLLGSSPVENDPNRMGQQYRRTKVRPVCKRRAVGLGASTNGTNTFVLMDAPC
jgi:hypothetical protein